MLVDVCLMDGINSDAFLRKKKKSRRLKQYDHLSVNTVFTPWLSEVEREKQRGEGERERICSCVFPCLLSSAALL